MNILPIKLAPTTILKYTLYIILIVALVSICYSIYEIENPQTPNSADDSDPIPTVKFPFKNLFDDKGQKLNVILIAAPFREKTHEELYDSYKAKGLAFAGISSYLEFPSKINNPFEDRFHEDRKHDYESMVSSWLHCFREPDKYLKDKIMPRILLAESDLKDTSAYKPNPTIKKEYDFMYVCLKDNDKCSAGWQSYNRNWELAQKCLVNMCKKYKLTGIIVGRENCPITEFCSGIVRILPFLPFSEFQAEMQKCRFLFVPNVSDASPRVITEAICYDMPVLVNKNIVGGWHNVIPRITGEFFSNEEDLDIALNSLITYRSSYTPRKWFLANRGKERSGRILAQFLIKHYPNLNNKTMKFATITI